MYGLLVIGPTFHWWYGKLEELTAELPERFRFIAKLLIDRIIFTPPFLVATLFYRKLFERSSMPEKVAELQRIFLSVLIVNWKVWTIVQGVNLTIVPIEYRALFGNVCALWWNIYLALFA
ncbi:Pxmp2 [Symbiodinium microadriaticum]|nr:Pxmp2 [Symbiodinium microadriaticum]